MDNKSLQALILSEKKQRDTLVLAHTYQAPEIIDIADFAGDSYALSVYAQKCEARRIILCGVRFMAETVKILSPDKTVILPVAEATCPMADNITPKQVRDFKKQNPDCCTVAYINTTAQVKAQVDVCVTSSSAVKIVSSLPQDRILFLPDANLGSYVAKRVPNKEIIIWDGCCPVHNQITAQDVLDAKAKHPNAVVAVHPECKKEVMELADMIGSTSEIIEYGKSQDGEVIIGTERGVVDYLEQKNPQGKYHQLSADKLTCQNMKMTRLQDVYQALIGVCGEEIELDEDLRIAAKRSIENMLKYGG
ncbi:MAG: quinolinate synthase NadA [Clostridia bacterium]|nr:quinolinate synthase NadA [Clostridia bacterium]